MKTFFILIFATSFFCASCTEQPRPQGTKATFDCLEVYWSPEDSTTSFFIPEDQFLEENFGFTNDPIFNSYYLHIETPEQGIRNIQFPANGMIVLPDDVTCSVYFLFAFDTNSVAIVHNEILKFINGETSGTNTPHMLGVCTGLTPCP